MWKQALAASILVAGVQACAVEVTPADDELTVEEGWSGDYDRQGEPSPGACANASVLDAEPTRPHAGPLVWEGLPEGKLVVPVECVEERYIYKGDPWWEDETAETF